MNKVIRDGKVAVIYATDYGSGWYTGHGNEELIFDPAIVNMILLGRQDLIEDRLKSAYPDVYWGYPELCICWIPEGVQFRIEGYDGMEDVAVKEDYHWMTA